MCVCVYTYTYICDYVCIYIYILTYGHPWSQTPQKSRSNLMDSARASSYEASSWPPKKHPRLVSSALLDSGDLWRLNSERTMDKPFKKNHYRTHGIYNYIIYIYCIYIYIVICIYIYSYMYMYISI